MKKVCVWMAALCFSTGAVAQKEQLVKADLYGFVSSYFCYDSRKSLQVAEDLFNILPLDKSLDATGADLNAVPSVKFLSITTRMGLNLTGPELLGAASQAKIETDFGGFSSSGTLLRIRQAYVKLNWQHSNLLVGQTWHPFSGDLMPDVFSLATGSPFNPFNRSPQVRFNWRNGRSPQLSLAMLYQFQYASVGLEGKPSALYAKQGLYPEAFLGAVFFHGPFTYGVGADVSSIVPRTQGFLNGQNVKVDERLTSYSALLQASYIQRALSVKAKVVYGQNLSHLLQPSGYGVTRERADGSYEYQPLQSLSGWLTMMYGTRVRYGFMAGYLKNLGIRSGSVQSGTPLVIWGNHAGVPSNVDAVYRFSPLLTYTVKNLCLGLELEHTGVAYGTTQSDGTVSHTHLVANNRVCLLVKYDF